VRIARQPDLLASAFGCPLSPAELATRLERALPGAAPGAVLDLTSAAAPHPASTDLRESRRPEPASTAVKVATERALAKASPDALRVSPATFWDKLVDTLREILGRLFLSNPETRTWDHTIDENEWRARATRLAAAGGGTLRAVVQSGNDVESARQLQRLIQELSPGLDTREAAGAARALLDGLHKVFAGASDADLAPLAPMLERPGTTAEARRDVARMLTSPGFARLDDAHRAAIVRILASTDTVLASPARQAMLGLVSSPDFQKKGAGDQGAALVKVLDDQPPGKSPLGAVAGGYEVARRFELVGPTEVKDYDFGSKVADARRYEVVIDGVHVPVYAAKTREGGSNHDVQDIADGLSRVPAGVLAAMREVRLQPTRNPADAHWAQVYDEAGFTSYMTAGESGVVDVWVKGAGRPQDVAASLVHETGHILSQRRWGGDADARWIPWKSAMSSDAVRASGYAKNSQGEDFSEALSLYAAVRGTPAEATYRALMPGRFAILDDVTRPAASGARPAVH
jgi:hypothetical protein